jgi:hypothetical protein
VAVFARVGEAAPDVVAARRTHDDAIAGRLELVRGTDRAPARCRRTKEHGGAACTLLGYAVRCGTSSLLMEIASWERSRLNPAPSIAPQR